MKEVLACLYNSHPSLMAATQAFAAKRMLIGSIYSLRHHLDGAVGVQEGVGHVIAF